MGPLGLDFLFGGRVETALQEKAALVAVKEALQAMPEPHYITHYLECYRHTDATTNALPMDCMYFITQ